MQNSFLDNTALDLSQRVRNDKRRGVYLFDRALHDSDFQPRHDAVKDVSLLAPPAPAPLVSRHAAIQIADNRVLNLRVLVRDDCDGCVLFDAVDDEVYRLRRREISKNGIQRRFDAELSNSGFENDSLLCRARHKGDNAEFRIMPSRIAANSLSLPSFNNFQSSMI